MKRITRQGDGGGRLALVIDDDGDVHVAVSAPAGNSAIEFCTGIGGGRSPQVLRALKALAEAIEKENESGRWPGLS